MKSLLIYNFIDKALFSVCHIYDFFAIQKSSQTLIFIDYKGIIRTNQSFSTCPFCSSDFFSAASSWARKRSIHQRYKQEAYGLLFV